MYVIMTRICWTDIWSNIILNVLVMMLSDELYILIGGPSIKQVALLNVGGSYPIGGRPEQSKSLTFPTKRESCLQWPSEFIINTGSFLSPIDGSGTRTAVLFWGNRHLASPTRFWIHRDFTITGTKAVKYFSLHTHNHLYYISKWDGFLHK